MTDRQPEPLRAALERLRALSDAATPGPWYWDDIMGGIGMNEWATWPDAAFIVAAVDYARAALAVPDGAVDLARCGKVWEQGECICICRLPPDHQSPHGWFRCEPAAPAAFLKGAQGQQEALDALAADRGAVDLDAAWREVEAVLPEGWGIGIQPSGSSPDGPIYEVGASPDTEWTSVIREIGLAAALTALAAGLRAARLLDAARMAEPKGTYPPCAADLSCYRNDGHDGDHAYPYAARLQAPPEPQP